MYKAIKRCLMPAHVWHSMRSVTRGNHVGIIMRNAGHYRGRQVPVRKFAITANVGYVMPFASWRFRPSWDPSHTCTHVYSRPITSIYLVYLSTGRIIIAIVRRLVNAICERKRDNVPSRWYTDRWWQFHREFEDLQPEICRTAANSRPVRIEQRRLSRWLYTPKNRWKARIKCIKKLLAFFNYHHKDNSKKIL